MPLNYDLQNVEADLDDKNVAMVSNALVWGTLSIAMGKITKENWKEFYTRCHMIETIHGAWLRDKKGPRPITPDDVKSHIGLRTNVVTVSNAKFKTDIDRRLREQAKYLME